MSTLQDAIKEAYTLCPTNKVIIHTLEIRQTGVQQPLFLVRAPQGITATDENGAIWNYEPCGFDFSLPPTTEEGFQSLNIAIDNVGRRTTAFVNAALSKRVPVECLYRPYLSDDLSQPQMIPPLLLWLKNLKITQAQVTATATFMDLVNKPFPLELYTRERFPTLG